MHTDQTVVAAQRKAYSDGVRDGIEVALRLLLGEEAEGGIPYDGNLNKSAREWAEAALARVRS